MATREGDPVVRGVAGLLAAALPLLTREEGIGNTPLAPLAVDYYRHERQTS
jgi:hypothetical protein